MLVDKIQEQINQAMKQGDKLRVDTLKMLSSSLHNAKIQKGLNENLTEEEAMHIVTKEAKKRKDAIEAYQSAVESKHGEDRERAQNNLEREQAELEILEEYLPEQLSDQELNMIVDKAIALEGGGNIQDMGRVMGKAMELVKGRADGGRVSAIVKEKLI